MWSDRAQRLHFVDIDTKAVTQIAESRGLRIHGLHLVARQPVGGVREARGRRGRSASTCTRSTSKQTIPATDAWYNSSEPVFSADGKLLFFVSARSFNPTYGQTEFEHVYTDMSRIYFVTLAKDTKSPFAPKSDEVKIKEEPKPASPT